MSKERWRIQRTSAVVLVVDLQQKLLPAIHAHQALLRNTLRLLNAATLLHLPLVSTEQYPTGLGPTVPEIASAIPEFAPIEKMTFSAGADEHVLAALRTRNTTDVVLCGIETHICVMQTCLDLIERGFRVFVISDAVSARSKDEHVLGLQRMTQAAAVMASTEMLLFELLERAGTGEFKQLLPWLKQSA